MKTWKQLCEEVYRWSREEYGEQGPGRAALGIAEVMMYKLQSAWIQGDLDAECDAVIETALYMLYLIGILGLNPEEVMRKEEPLPDQLRSIDYSVGQLSGACLKLECEVRDGEDHLETAESALKNLSWRLHEELGEQGNLQELVSDAWEDMNLLGKRAMFEQYKVTRYPIRCDPTGRPISQHMRVEARIPGEDGLDDAFVVDLRFDDETDRTFSVTSWYKGRTGTDHKEIARHVPELEPFLKWGQLDLMAASPATLKEFRRDMKRLFCWPA